MPAQPASRVLLTPVVRLSYPALFESRAMRNNDGTLGKERYGATLLFDERSKADPDYQKLMVELSKEVNLFAQRRWPEEFVKAKVPFLDDSIIKTPWLDPTGPKYRDQPWAKGCVRFIRPSSQRKVPCVDRQRVPVTDPEILYPGCYVKALLAVFTYDNNGNHGPGFGLRGVQFVENGERLDGGVDVSEAFPALDPIEGDNPFGATGNDNANAASSAEADLARMFG